MGRHYKMRYSTEPKYRKYVKAHGFLSFARKFREKYGKKLMDTKIADKITSARGKSKKMVKQRKQKQFTFHQKKDSK